MAFCCLKLPKSFSYVIDGATWWSADIIFELRMFYNIELSSFPGSMASNWELVKINLAPIDLLHSGSFSALTSAKMRHCFWSHLAFRDGLDYLRFEYEVIWAMAFWEKCKKSPKMGFLGLFQTQMLKSRVLWESFITKQPPNIIFWDIIYHKKPTGALQKA